MSDENEGSEDDPVGQRQSPSANRPYLEVLTGPVYRMGRTIELSGRGHEAGSIIDISIDNRIVQKVVVGRQGTFLASAQAPNQVGLHSLTITDARSGRVLDGAFVTVKPGDEPRASDRARPR